MKKSIWYYENTYQNSVKQPMHWLLSKYSPHFRKCLRVGWFEIDIHMKLTSLWKWHPYEIDKHPKIRIGCNFVLTNKGYKGEHYVFCRIKILVRYFFLTRTRYCFKKNNFPRFQKDEGKNSKNGCVFKLPKIVTEHYNLALKKPFRKVIYQFYRQRVAKAIWYENRVDTECF